MSNNSDIQTLAGTGILLAVIAAIVLLAWHKVLTGTATAEMLITIIGLGGGALAVHAGAKVGARAAGVTDSVAPTTDPDPTS